MMEEERTLSALSNLLAVSPSHSDQSVRPCRIHPHVSCASSIED
jgi:hypothetical protein